MRPLFHPRLKRSPSRASCTPFDPVRVAIYADIVGSACSQTCSSFLQVNNKDIPKSTLSLHFRILLRRA